MTIPPRPSAVCSWITNTSRLSSVPSALLHNGWVDRCVLPITVPLGSMNDWGF
jgi:hypothetical protein